MTRPLDDHDRAEHNRRYLEALALWLSAHNRHCETTRAHGFLQPKIAYQDGLIESVTLDTHQTVRRADLEVLAQNLPAPP